MERMHAIADAHYRAGPPTVQNLAFNFFKALDSDGDGRVSLHEFLALMNHEGHTRLANPLFFRDLDRDGNGFLEFGEVLTLYYIIKSGRPICRGCNILITDTYFSCVECFDSAEWPDYSLCIHCYRSKVIPHYHGNHQQFLDTFTLLQTKKRPPQHHNQEWSHSPVVQEANWSSSSSSSPQEQNAIVPATQMSAWKAALMALEIGLSIGSITTTLCTIL